MEQGFLVDTNILIYYLADLIPAMSSSKINKIFQESLNISVISKIEFLGWNKFTSDSYKKAESLVAEANILPLDDMTVERAIQLRRKKQIKIPDAIIAATCLNLNLILVTRNIKDFEKIGGLDIYNPFPAE